MARKQVLFIQGAGDGAYQEDKKLVANLRHTLGSSYEIDYPEMKNEDEADYETWADQIEKSLYKLDDGVIVVGHSVGASTLIKFFCENESEKTVAGIFLIAAPYWGGDMGWTYDGYETLALPPKIDASRFKNVPIFFYHSQDDEVVPFDHLSLYADRFPAATIRDLDGRGHQLNNDLSEVAKDIKALK